MSAIDTDSSTPVAAEGVTCAWGGKIVLSDIDLQVRRSEIMVIMGGSGSGKSTLLRHLLGLNRPRAGTIRLFDEDPHQLSSRALHALRSHIGMSFQGGALFNSMTVAENIAMPLREHTQLDDETIAIMVRMKLELVRLRGAETLMPSQLSGGMLKRAALARAIILDPPLLFFDEPSAGLDPVVAEEMDQLILRLRDTLGTTVVVVTHEMASAMALADRIAVLGEGGIIFCDTRQAFQESTDERIQALLQRRPPEAEIDPEAFLARLTEQPQ